MFDSFFNILKKLLVGTTVFIFVFTITYIPLPHVQVAEATVPVFDAANFSINSQQLFQTTSQTVKDLSLDSIALAVARQMISLMLQSTIDWINSGFEGSPAFIQDLDNFLLQAADIVAAEYLIQELGSGASFLCEPFRLDLRIALAAIYDQAREREQASCTLTGIFENVQNFQEFITGDFEQGGWDAWFDLVAKPNRTPYGAVLEAEGELRARILDAQGREVVTAGWGNGFLSGKACEPGDGPQSRRICQIVKPGRVISDHINKALGVEQDALVSADEINEVVAALVGQLTRQAITGAAGLLGLSGSTGYTPYSRGAFVTEVRTNNSNIVGGVNTNSTGGNTVPYDPLANTSVPLTNRLSQTLTAQQTFLTRIEQYTTDLQAIVTNPASTEFMVAQAQSALIEAATIQSQITSQIDLAARIVRDYTALENEYSSGVTPERQAAIRLEQSQLIQDFTALGLPSESQIDTAQARWDAIIRLAMRPNDPAAQCDSVQFDPDCDRTPVP